jgi:hypothetical protein
LTNTVFVAESGDRRVLSASIRFVTIFRSSLDSFCAIFPRFAGFASIRFADVAFSAFFTFAVCRHHALSVKSIVRLFLFVKRKMSSCCLADSGPRGNDNSNGLLRSARNDMSGSSFDRPRMSGQGKKSTKTDRPAFLTGRVAVKEWIPVFTGSIPLLFSEKFGVRRVFSDSDYYYTIRVKDLFRR